MAASVVAGVHKSIPEAQAAMGGGFETVYHPDASKVLVYEELYEQYKSFGQFVEEETAR